MTSRGWPDEGGQERNSLLGHRCFETRLEGILRYDPPRPNGRTAPWRAVVELPEEFASRAREAFLHRHGIALEPPEFGFHMTVFRGAVDRTDALERSWAAFDGERVGVLLTGELFWKGRCVWANAHCPEHDLLRSLAGLDASDPEGWGHATVGCFPPGLELPRFLDYRDLEDWGFRP